MSAKILLAAFRSLSAAKENVCEQLCRRLVAKYSERVDYVVLEVGPNAEGYLHHALSSDPGGILLMHEDRSLKWHHFHIEDHAYELEQPLQLIPSIVGRRLEEIQGHGGYRV